MNEEEVRSIIMDITEQILDRNRDYKFIIEDCDRSVLGGMNKTDRTVMEIHSYMPEESTKEET